MFNKKKSKQPPYVPPVKPPNRVLKDWGNRRLVETFEAQSVAAYEDAATGQTQVVRYHSTLVLEKASKDSLGSTKYDVERTEISSSGYSSLHSSLYDMSLLFEILRQTYVGKVD